MSPKAGAFAWLTIAAMFAAKCMSFRTGAKRIMFACGGRLDVGRFSEDNGQEHHGMTPHATECIYCGAPAGSAEHTVLAALGGLRTDRGVLCRDCNVNFGNTVDSVLVEDMRHLNALVGARHGRTKKPLAATVEEAGTGRIYRLTEGRRLEHPRPLVLSDSTEDRERSICALVSSEKQLSQFLHDRKAEGRSPTLMPRESVPMLFANRPILRWGFGGSETFRAVARLAVNVLASQFPALAREPWLRPCKDFIRNGGDSDEWVWYEYRVHPDTQLPKDSFRFQHRFLLGFDATSGLVYSRVSLLGVYELSVRLGRTEVGQSETLVYDMDVLARTPPLDIQVARFEGALDKPECATPNPELFVLQGIRVVQVKRNDQCWEEDAPSLVAAINNARCAEPSTRHDRIAQALDGQQQRLLNLATFVAHVIRRDFIERFGEAGAPVGDAFGELTQPDRTSPMGVTSSTRDNIDAIRRVVAGHLVAIVGDHAIDSHDLRRILEGGPGAALVGRHMFEQVRWVHPELELGDGD